MTRIRAMSLTNKYLLFVVLPALVFALVEVLPR